MYSLLLAVFLGFLKHYKQINMSLCHPSLTASLLLVNGNVEFIPTHFLFIIDISLFQVVTKFITTTKCFNLTPVAALPHHHTCRLLYTIMSASTIYPMSVRAWKKSFTYFSQPLSNFSFFLSILIFLCLHFNF